MGCGPRSGGVLDYEEQLGQLVGGGGVVPTAHKSSIPERPRQKRQRLQPQH